MFSELIGVTILKNIEKQMAKEGLLDILRKKTKLPDYEIHC